MNFKLFDKIRIYIACDEAGVVGQDNVYVYGKIINVVTDKSGHNYYDVQGSPQFEIYLDTEPETCEKPSRLEELLYF